MSDGLVLALGSERWLPLSQAVEARPWTYRSILLYSEGERKWYSDLLSESVLYCIYINMSDPKSHVSNPGRIENSANQVSRFRIPTCYTMSTKPQ
jgi:hypothetical protein